MNDGLSTSRKYSSHRLLDIVPDSLNSWDAIATKKGKIQHKIRFTFNSQGKSFSGNLKFTLQHLKIN